MHRSMRIAGSVAPWVRAQVRIRWRGWVLLALLMIVLGGAALTAAAGARRTDTALSRYEALSHTGEDIEIGPVFPGIARLPEVEHMAEIIGEPLFHVGPDGSVDKRFPVPVATTGYDLTSFIPPLIRAGRVPRPGRPYEAFATVAAANRLHLHVGSRLTLRDVSSLLRNGRLGQGSYMPPGVGTPVTFTIVGIGVGYTDVLTASAGQQGGAAEFATVYLTRAYALSHGGASGGIYTGGLLHLRQGADIARVRREIHAIATAHPVGASGSSYDMSNLRLSYAAVQQGLEPDVVSLWLFASLVGLAALLVVGQALSRQVWTAAADWPTLRALGTTRTQFLIATTMPAAVVAGLGTLGAAATATAASPLMPVGPARVAETHPGVEVNVALLGVALAVLVVGTFGQAALASRRATARSGPRWTHDDRPSLAQLTAILGLPVAAATGLQFAFARRHQVPVYRTVAATVLTIAAVVAAVTFNGNLARLYHTPARYGWSWDLAVDGGYSPLPVAAVSSALRRVPQVAAWAGGNYGTVVIDKRMVPAVGIDELHGSVFPTLLNGRPPRGTDEIVLGGRTMKAVDAHVGSRIVVQADGVRKRSSVTGQAVLPDFERGGFTATDLGTGAVTTSAVLHPTGIPTGAAYDFVLVRYQAGTDVRGAQHSVERALREACRTSTCNYFVDRRPNEVNAYNQVAWTPLLLVSLLGALAVLAVVHTLVTFVRRRRRDIGVLKTLGFTQRQVSTTVVWQATTLVASALVLGIPTGVAAGRWIWKEFAGQLGVAADPLVPLAAVVLIGASALLVGNLVAIVPAWTAARLNTAQVLKTE